MTEIEELVRMVETLTDAELDLMKCEAVYAVGLIDLEKCRRKIKNVDNESRDSCELHAFERTPMS